MEVLDDDIYESSNDEVNDWAQFIQSNSERISERIIPKWKQFKVGNSKVSVNLVAAILGFFWLAYRKMYLLLSISLLVFGVLQPLGNFSPIIGFVLFLVLGDWAYYNHAQIKIREIKQQNLSPSQYKEALKAKGGTNMVLPIIMVIFLLMVFGLLIVFLSGLTDLIR